MSSRKNDIFSVTPLFKTGFRLISMGMAKKEFYNNKGIFSAKLDIIKQLFYVSCIPIKQNLDFF